MTAIVLCSSLTGCISVSTQAPTPAAQLSPSPAPSPALATTSPVAVTTPASSDAEIRAGIQRAVDSYAQAYNQHDPELLKQAVDQSNPPFRRFMQTRFEGAQPSSPGEQRSYTVREILKHRPFGFVLARIESEGRVSDVTFRQIDGRWMMSEATEDQIGERRQQESMHFTFYTYPWLDEINPTIMNVVERARENVLRRLGKVSNTKPIVHIKPIFSVGSPEDPYTRAIYLHSYRFQDRIEIFAPQSYAFGFYDPSLGWEHELEQILTHEYTHLVNDREFIALAKMSDWMSEGLADFIAGISHQDDLRDVVRSNRIIPIIDTSNSRVKRDLQHFELLEEDSGVTYGLAYSLVVYITERYGGLDGFWKLAYAYERAQNPETALQQAFGVSYEQFDRDWRAWLKTTYQ